MNTNNRRWKLLARQALWGRPGLPILACFLVMLLNLAGSYLSGIFFPGTGAMSIVLGEIFALGLSVLFCLFSAGLYRMLLHMARREEYQLSDLLWYFKNQPDRILMASLVLAVIAWLTSLPASIYNYSMPAPTTEQEYYNLLLTYMILSLAGVAVNLLVTVPLSMTYYLLCDNEELGGMEALKRSAAVMKGHALQYILLQISFLPLLLLGVVTFYLALLLVVPYMEMSNVMFYRDLIGDIGRNDGGSEYEYV